MRTLKLLLAFLALLLSPLVVVGCHVQLIMDYDSVVDQQLVQVQQQTEQFLGQLQADAGTPKAAYANTQTFYVQTAAELQTIRTRVQYEPKSTEVLTQIGALQKSLSDMQAIQKAAGPNGLDPTQIEFVRAPLETQFAAIAQLQVALKNRVGKQPSNAMAPALSH